MVVFKIREQMRLDFLGVGAAKCGTTWLSDILKQHPEVQFSVRKEVNFFNARAWGGKEVDSFGKGLEFYRTFWPKHVSEEKKIGECSPIYLFDKVAPKRIKKLFPGVKILVMLRNPVDMVYSRYVYNREFHQSFPRSWGLEKALEKFPWMVKSGLFAEQLERYYKIFPKNQIKVILLDDVKKNAESVAKDVYVFIGVDDSFVPDTTPANVSKQVRFGWLQVLVKNAFGLPSRLFHAVAPRRVRRWVANSYAARWYYALKAKLVHANTVPLKKSKMDVETRKRLYGLFAKDIKKLEKMLNRDLSAWTP